MPDEMKKCPQCECPYAYAMDEKYVCPDCSHEWIPKDETIVEGLVVIDSNGQQLANGDSVVIIKDLPVKGAPKAVKAGTKVKNIRLVEGDHNIDCKIDGFGKMGLKSEFVKKA